MCGIIGIFNSKGAYEKIAEGIDCQKQRGNDAFGIANGKEVFHFASFTEMKNKKALGKNLVAHNLHSIVGFVEQPLRGNGILAVNGEIYNWQELCREHRINAANDSELLLKLIEKEKKLTAGKLGKILDGLNGDYSFAYWFGGKVFLARDLMGIKPLWTARKGKEFGFASERKSLIAMGFALEETRELHPRHIIEFDVKKNKISDFYRGFYKYGQGRKVSFEKAKEKTRELLYESVRLRTPEKKFGLLFSGGIDSTLLAAIAKKQGADFICYTAATSEKSKDLLYAKKAAEKLGLNLKYKIVPLKDVEKYLERIVPLVEDSSTVKAAVSLPFFIACEMAKDDGIKVMLSGSGSDEIFCGYERHGHGKELAKESYYELLRFFERNSYRDDVITMFNGVELRVPYLDKNLVEFALNLPDEFKIKESGKNCRAFSPGFSAEKAVALDAHVNWASGCRVNKYILRQVALEEKIPEEFAMRKKTAAQYGSGFDDDIERLAKASSKGKAEYLAKFLKHKNLRLGALISTGKDSLFAAKILEQQNYEIACLITLKSKDKDSYMFHTPNVSLAKMQAKAMGKPLVELGTKGEKEKELLDLEKAIKIAVEKYKIEGIASGAIHSNYQRERIEVIADRLGIKSFSPLWHIHEDSMLNALLRQSFKIMIVKTAAAGMEGLAGEIIDKETVKKLLKVKEKYGISIVGEGGEYESLVLEAPMFSKRIEIIEKEIVKKGDVEEVIIKKARLV